MTTVHQITKSEKVKGTYNVEVTAKCGVSMAYRSSNRLPATFSGWNSRVTCDDCLGYE